MSYHFGKMGYVGMALQDTQGTAETTLNMFVPVEEMPTLKGQVEQKYPQEYRKTLAEASDFYRTKISASGNFNIPARPSGGLEHAMYGVLGAKSSTKVGPSTTYKHTLTVGSTLPYFTVGIGRSTLNMEMFKDVVFSSVDMSFAPGEELKLNCSVQGIPEGIGTSAMSPSYGTERVLTFNDISVSLGGSANCDIIDVSLKIDRGVKSVRTACANAGLFDNMLYPTTTSVEGTINMFFQDYTEYKYWLGSSTATNFDANATAETMKRALSIEATGPEIETDYNNEFNIYVPKIVYDDAPIDMPFDDRMKVQFNFKALYDGTQTTGKEVVWAEVQSLLTEITSPT